MESSVVAPPAGRAAHGRPSPRPPLSPPPPPPRLGPAVLTIIMHIVQLRLIQWPQDENIGMPIYLVAFHQSSQNSWFIRVLNLTHLYSYQLPFTMSSLLKLFYYVLLYRCLPLINALRSREINVFYLFLFYYPASRGLCPVLCGHSQPAAGHICSHIQGADLHLPHPPGGEGQRGPALAPHLAKAAGSIPGVGGGWRPLLPPAWPTGRLGQQT